MTDTSYLIFALGQTRYGIAATAVQKLFDQITPWNTADSPFLGIAKVAGSLVTLLNPDMFAGLTVQVAMDKDLRQQRQAAMSQDTAPLSVKWEGFSEGDRLSHALQAIRALEEAVTGNEAQVNVFRVLAELMGSEEKAEGRLRRERSVERGQEADGKAEVESLEVEAVHFELSGVEPLETRGLEVEPFVAEQVEFIGMNGFTNGAMYGTVEMAGLNGNGAIAPPAPSTAPKPAEEANSTAPGYRIETIRGATQNLDSLLAQAGELTVTKIRIAHRLAELAAIAALWDEWNRDLFKNRCVFDGLHQGNDVLHWLEAFHGRTEEQLEGLGKRLQELQSSLYEDTARLELISDELEEDIRTLCLVPLTTIFNAFPRMVQDLARQEGKQVNFVVEGSETRVDKRILEEMKDPLMHILLNAIDHGIESPEERQRRGKPPPPPCACAATRPLL